MWNLKTWCKWTCLQNRNLFTNIENKLMATKGEGVDRLGVWDWHIHTTVYKINRTYCIAQGTIFNNL